jgi:hypothetical protein
MKNETGWAFSTMGDGIGAYRVLGRGGLRERVHLEDLGVDGRIILKPIFK